MFKVKFELFDANEEYSLCHRTEELPFRPNRKDTIMFEESGDTTIFDEILITDVYFSTKSQSFECQGRMLRNPWGEQVFPPTQEEVDECVRNLVEHGWTDEQEEFRSIEKRGL